MKRILAPLVLILAVTGCSGPPAANDGPGSASATTAAAPTTEAPKLLKPGAYTFENAGAKGTMEVPGQPDPEIEHLRALAGSAPEVTYLTVSVDNRAGTVGANMYGVSIFTPEGKEIQYKNADSYINSITPSGAPATVYNQFIEVANRHGEMVKPQAFKDFVLTGPPVPAEISGIEVYPTGASNPVKAVPAP